MGTITNKTTCDIQVHTPAGDFVFKKGESVELADERVELVAKHGAMYFQEGELAHDSDFPQTEGTAGESTADDAIKNAAPAVKTTVKTKKSKP